MSVFNVENFRTALGAGGSRPNQFQVILTAPSGAPLPGGFARDSSFLVTAASLPGQTIGTAITFYRGREVKMAGDRVFAPWTTTIINDTAMITRTAIENWINSMEDLQNKNGVILPRSYYGDLTVQQLDRNGGVSKVYKFLGAFPTDISEVGLSYDANDQISSFTCTWQYQDFVTTGVGSAAPSPAGISVGIFGQTVGGPGDEL